VRRKDTTHADLFCKHCQVGDPSRLGGQKAPVYPVILLATYTRTLIFAGFFGRESGPKNKRPLLRFFGSSNILRVLVPGVFVTEKRLRRFNFNGCSLGEVPRNQMRDPQSTMKLTSKMLNPVRSCHIGMESICSLAARITQKDAV
jgi:hypothetical protein